MKDWMDFNDDQLENDEVMFAKENLYISNEVLFGSITRLPGPPVRSRCRCGRPG